MSFKFQESFKGVVSQFIGGFKLSSMKFQGHFRVFQESSYVSEESFNVVSNGV